MELKLPLPSPKRELPVLLIVPYGIETLINVLVSVLFDTFNRTLWN